MASKDFNLEELAAYLHLAPAVVSRMADRGRLPGRRIAGEWRFAEADIHHWLERRIGAADDDGLGAVEDILDRSSSGEEPLSIAAMLGPGSIAVPLVARTRASVIASICERAAESGLLWDPEKMAVAVREREELHPTALDNGVALLHPRRPLPSILAEPILAFGRTDTGIPFGGARGLLTDLFFLICSTTDRGHLRTLARLSRLISMPTFLPGLRSAHDADDVRLVIVEHDEQLME